jgi:hypothetical protein
MPFGMNNLTMGLEDADTSFLETRLEQSNLDFEDSQTVSWRHREGAFGWTVSVRRASVTPHGCPAGAYDTVPSWLAQDTTV